MNDCPHPIAARHEWPANRRLLPFVTGRNRPIAAVRDCQRGPFIQNRFAAPFGRGISLYFC
ncbi:hypothetical protein FHW68_001223 [Pseudomonas sp. Tn43]|nr:hypothetical protein [Pseudomonas sp. Tn43]